MRDLRLLDVVLGALMIGLSVVHLPLPFPTENLAIIALVLLGLLRSSRATLGPFEFLVPGFAVALFYLGAISIFAVPSEGAADWPTRLLRFLLILLFMYMIAVDRVSGRSVVAGMAATLVVNVPLFYAGLVPTPYGSALTGLLGDKNVAGLAYALIGVLMMLLVRSWWWRVPVLGLFAGMLWLTGSRTALAGFAAAVVWLLLAPRLPVIARWLLALVLAFGVDILSEDYSQVGVFSGREGSDVLRARIDAASEIKVGEAGFWGKGLGEAFVEMEGRYWFFHNSYWSALVEGGWPWAVFLVGVTVLVLMRPFRHDVPREQYIAQAAGVVVLVCAWRLGEVFMTPYWGLAMGVALALMLKERTRVNAQAEPTGSTGAVEEARR